MRGQEPVIASEAVRSDLVHDSLDVATDLHRVWCREGEVRDTNPCLIAGISGIQLELLGNLRVLAGTVVCPLDPDHSEIGAFG